MKVFHSFILSLVVCFSQFFSASLVQATEPVRGIEALPDRAQFLIIIDDSVSMDDSQPSDPNRLAVLAAKSFLYLLSEDDRVVIIGMNQLARMDVANPDSVSLRNREQALVASQSELQEKTRDPERLASYLGNQTPCRSALERAGVLLNHWDKKNPERLKTRQILMFMTDGDCFPEAAQVPEPAVAWKKRIDSQNRLQFFLVRFDGKPYTKILEEYADRQMIIQKEETKQLSSMTDAFSKVFSFARGYSVEKQNRKFPKAEKVHVLAFRKKTNVPLKFEIRDEQGKPITRNLHQEDTGSLTFSPVGRKKTAEYEYLAIQITPDGLPFQFKFFPEDTHFLVVPDYRRLETKIIVNKGSCGAKRSLADEEKQKTLDVDVGTQYCVRMGLKSSKGYLNAEEDLDFKYKLGIVANCDVDGDNCAFSTQAGSQEGTQPMSGKVTIGETEKFEVVANPWTLSFIVKQIEAKITSSQNLENIPAGQKRVFSVEFKGKFPPNLQLAFDTHPSDSCLVRFGLDEERRTAQPNDKGGLQEVFNVNPGMTRQFVIETKRCRGRSSFSGRVTFRIVSADPSLKDPSIELTYRIRQTSFWDYYGALIIKIAILLFLFSVLVCFIRGWMMPMRIPKNKDFWFFYANRENVDKADPAFANPNEQFGAKPMRTKLRDSFGWYRNPFVAINSRISWLGPEFALEYCSIGNKEGFYVVQKSGFQLASVNIADLQDSEHAFQAIDFYTPRPTISAFFLCRLYARLFGRLRSVRFSKRMIETGKWYRISSGETEFFFKIGSDPNTLSEDI